MSFEHPWALLLLLLPLAWLVWEWQAAGRRLGVGLEDRRVRGNHPRHRTALAGGFRKQGCRGNAGGYIGQRIAG